MTKDQILSMIDIIQHLLKNPEPTDGIANAKAYMDMMVKELNHNEAS